MNIENIDLNQPFTARVLGLMQATTKCVNKVLSKSSLDDESIMEIIARLSAIESRELLFLNCLQHPKIEEALKDVDVNDEIEFMEASDDYIRSIMNILKDID